ncbi:MAG: hypothetical protein ABIR47_09940 [Candidatus Kapaibacterium sp.]
MLRVVLASIVIKTGTGELGVLHGMRRFVGVSSHISFRKKDLSILDSLAKKSGLSNGVRRITD